MALRQGKVPEELAEAALCRFMGWGWVDLMSAPAQVVADIFDWMRIEGALAREREAVARGKREHRG